MSQSDTNPGRLVLITGGAGYIGSHTVLALLEHGYRAVILDNLSTGRTDAVPASAELVQGDCGDKNLLNGLFERLRPDALIHFAGSIVVEESVQNPLEYYRNNTSNSRVVVEACTQRAVPMMFSSTAAVYGNPPTSGPIAEDAPTAPISPYGRSKLMTEWMMRDAAAAHAWAGVALRYFNVAGADPGGRAGQSGKVASHLIRAAARVALGLQPMLNVYGDDYPTADGTCVRDYIHVSDLATAHVSALEYLLKGGGWTVFNCGYGRGASVLDVVGSVERVTGRPLPVRMAPRRDGDPTSLVASSQLLRSRTGWRPSHDKLDEIVASAMDWERRLVGQVS